MGTNGTHRSHEVPSLPNPTTCQERLATPLGSTSPTLFEQCRVFFYVPHELISAGKCCETGPTVFRPHPRRLESLTIRRCHYKGALSSHLFKDPECWSGRGLNPRPSAPRTGALSTELTRRRLINQDWSNIQSKNYGDNSLMSQECTEALCSFHVKGTKWNEKQIKPLIINAILFIFFEPAFVVNRYMTCALFKLDFEEKNSVFFKKKTWVLKKKTWVVKTSEFFFKEIWV